MKRMLFRMLQYYLGLPGWKGSFAGDNLLGKYSYFYIIYNSYLYCLKTMKWREHCWVYAAVCVPFPSRPSEALVSNVYLGMGCFNEINMVCGLKIIGPGWWRIWDISPLFFCQFRFLLIQQISFLRQDYSCSTSYIPFCFSLFFLTEENTSWVKPQCTVWKHRESQDNLKL